MVKLQYVLWYNTVYMQQTFFIQTFGCIQNQSDSERVKAYYTEQGLKEAGTWQKADVVVINTCIVRESAENRAYGLINNIDIYRKETGKNIKIVVTGCLPGVAHHVVNKEQRLKKIEELYKKFPQVQEFLPIKNISFELDPLRDKKRAGMVTISTGCNNFCSFCIVPMARGKEISRPFEEVLAEVEAILASGFEEIVLIGQNVNSYGSDLVQLGQEYILPDGNKVLPVIVRNMGKPRIPTLFPYLLEMVAKKPFKKVGFVSSNPWDFSDELIDVIARNKNIDRVIHLPVQSGDDGMLLKMKRAYTAADYLALVKKIREKVEGVEFTTDVIIGFSGETEEQFQNTVTLCKEVGYKMVYLNKYSPRKGTFSAHNFPDDVPSDVKHERWKRADIEINHFEH